MRGAGVSRTTNLEDNMWKKKCTAKYKAIVTSSSEVQEQECSMLLLKDQLGKYP